MNILSIENIIKCVAFRNKYDLLSNDVAKKIFDVIKNNYGTRTNAKDSFYEKQEEEYVVDYLIQFVNRDDIKTNIKARFYYPDEITDPYVDINICIGLNFTEQDLERLYWKLYESIRHEYEHFNKYLKGFYPDQEYDKLVEALDNLNLSDIEKAQIAAKYILDPIEIDSYAKSIMYVAKKRKIPYLYVIEDVIDRVIFSNDKDIKNRMLKNKEIGIIMEDVRGGLVGRINKIYPATVLRDEF